MGLFDLLGLGKGTDPQMIATLRALPSGTFSDLPVSRSEGLFAALGGLSGVPGLSQADQVGIGRNLLLDTGIGLLQSIPTARQHGFGAALGQGLGALTQARQQQFQNQLLMARQLQQQRAFELAQSRALIEAIQGERRLQQGERRIGLQEREAERPDLRSVGSRLVAVEADGTVRTIASEPDLKNVGPNTTLLDVSNPENPRVVFQGGPEKVQTEALEGLGRRADVAAAGRLSNALNRYPGLVGLRGASGEFFGGLLAEVKPETGNVIANIASGGADLTTLRENRVELQTFALAAKEFFTGEAGSRLSEGERALALEQVGVFASPRDANQVQAALRVLTKEMVKAEMLDDVASGSAPRFNLQTQSGAAEAIQLFLDLGFSERDSFKIVSDLRSDIAGMGLLGGR